MIRSWNLLHIFSPQQAGSLQTVLQLQPLQLGEEVWRSSPRLPTHQRPGSNSFCYNSTKNNFKITAFECNFWAIHTVQHHVTQCLFPPSSFHLHLRNSFRRSIGIFLWFLAEFGRKWSLEENIDKVRKKGLTYQTGNKLLEERVLRLLIYLDYVETNWECCAGV